MKKIVSIVYLIVLLLPANLLAQVGIPKASALDVTGKTPQYFYNVEAKGFLVGSYEWGTRASISPQTGYLCRFEKNGSTYQLADQYGGNWHALDYDGDGNIWVDGEGRAGSGLWTFNVNADGSFTISSTYTSGLLSVVGYNPRLFMSEDPVAMSTWIAVSKEDYFEYHDNYPKDLVVSLFGADKVGQNIVFADAAVKALCVANWDLNGDGELGFVEAAAVTDLGEVFKYNTEITSFDEFKYFIGVTSIREWSFHGCRGLTSIELPNSVTTIGGWMFEGCEGLTSLTIPSSVTHIDYLGSLPNLVKITVDKSNPVYDSRNNCNAIIETATNTLITGCIGTIIPKDVTSIGPAAFRGTWSLRSIVIPSNITSIGSEAFAYCSSLRSVLSQMTTPCKFGENAFYSIPSDDCVLWIPNGTLDAYIAAGWTEDVFRGGIHYYNILVDDDMENNDASNYTVLQGREYRVETPVNIITDPLNADNHCIAVQSLNNPYNYWDTEFFVKSSRALKPGTGYMLKMKVRADKEADVSYGIHQTPGVPVQDGGSLTFTTDWVEHCFIGTIEADGVMSFAFQLNHLDESIMYYIDDIELIESRPVKQSKALEGMLALMQSTNVYTREAYDIYLAHYEDCLAKNETGELAETVINPYVMHGWHSSNDFDDLLLSAWTIGGQQCKDFETPLYINTWSNEADDKENSSGMHVPFFEYWTADENSLDANTLEATLTDLENGTYAVEALVRVRIKNGASAPANGITMSVNGGDAVDVCNGKTCGDGDEFLFDTFTATGVVSDGTLRITFNVADNNNISWLAFKNVNYTAAICKAPTISRDGTNNRVVMNSATPGVSIYYTTNGTTPTENNTRYTGPIVMTKNCTVKAIAVKEGYAASEVATFEVDWFKVATPTFNYDNLQLTISTTTYGATIYYTTDGSTPTTSSTKYSGPLSLSENCTVKAIAVKAFYSNSDVATYSFVKNDQTCQTPQISQDGTSNRVVIVCATSGASIYYTTDGTTPNNGSTLYNGPITVDHNQTIRAIAMKDGMFNSSLTRFSVNWFIVATPTFDYDNLQLTISTETEGARIYYTTNGTNPLSDLTRSIRYTTPIRLESNAKVQAAAVKTDYKSSDVATYDFVRDNYVCQKPTIQRDGTTNRLKMSCAESNATIYYTTDGSTPTTSSTRYTEPVTMTLNCVVRAIAARSDRFPSEVSEFAVNWLSGSAVEVAYDNGVLALTYVQGADIYYEIGGKDATTNSQKYTGPISLTDNREVRYVVYVSGKEQARGSYTPNDFVCAPVTMTYDGLNIELSTADVGATIYYTTDRTLPTTSSEIYRGKISLRGLCTVNAFATKQYKNDSEMMSEPITYFFNGTDVFLSEAGRLGDAVKRDKEDIETLNVKCQDNGELNASDFSALRSIKSLKYLNLKEALFENNTVPDGAFANMNVVSIEFPSTETKVTRIEGNVFKGSNHLAAIVWMAPIKMAQSASALGITNPNLLIYVDNKSFAPQGVRNIVENESASSIVLTDDGLSFWCPLEFTAQRISYTHTYTQTTGINDCSGWETIVLPFEVQNVTHERAGNIAPFAANDANARPFWLGELTTSGFRKASKIHANTPYIISMPNSEEYGDSYILKGEVTFEANNTLVPVTEVKTIKKGTHVFTPCFDAIDAASSVYAINKYDQSNSYPEGSAFLPNYSDVKPFEAYINVPSSASAPRYIPIREDDETEIQDIIFNGQSSLVGAYDLTGRKLNEVPTVKGVYIVNGKKIVVK